MPRSTVALVDAGLGRTEVDVERSTLGALPREVVSAAHGASVTGVGSAVGQAGGATRWGRTRELGDLRRGDREVLGRAAGADPVEGVREVGQRLELARRR